MSPIQFRKKRVVLLLFIILLLFIFIHYAIKSEDISGCGTTALTLPCFEQLFPQVIKSLDALGISSFLCYNALWGVLTMKKPLPWMNKVELCLRNEEVMHVDEGHMARTFKRYNVVLKYDSANGLYSAKFKENKECEVYLYVFEEDKMVQQIRRIGWKHRILPPDTCDILHCFPASLILPPLSSKNFLGARVSIPHEGFEIQKYLFPDSWWKELSAPNCDQ